MLRFFPVVAVLAVIGFTGALTSEAPKPVWTTAVQGPGCEDMELREAALNALLQMDTDQALPILDKVLERRDDCSVRLRRKAVCGRADGDSP